MATYIAIMTHLRAVVTVSRASLMFEGVNHLWGGGNLQPDLEKMSNKGTFLMWTHGQKDRHSSATVSKEILESRKKADTK